MGVVGEGALGKHLVFSYLLRLLPLLLQGVEHDPAQLLDVVLLPGCKANAHQVELKARTWLDLWSLLLSHVREE